MLVLGDRRKIAGNIQKALADTATEANKANQTALQLNRYPWLQLTKRQNGETAGLIRDIVDLGNLVGSQDLHQVSPGVFAITWGGERAPYAAVVFYGGVHKSGTPILPRKWIYEAIRGSSSAPSQWRNPNAILNISDHFVTRYKYYASR
jgi:hypothetical protein